MKVKSRRVTTGLIPAKTLKMGIFANEINTRGISNIVPIAINEKRFALIGIKKVATIKIIIEISLNLESNRWIMEFEGIYWPITI